MFINWNLLIMCSGGIGLSMIIYFVVKYIAYNSLDVFISFNDLKNTKNNKKKYLKSIERNLKLARTMLIGLWVIAIAIIVIFHGTGVYKTPLQIGNNVVYEESKNFTAPTNEEIKITNKTIINEKETIINEEVKSEQQKSIDEFNKFLENN